MPPAFNFARKMFASAFSEGEGAGGAFSVAAGVEARSEQPLDSANKTSSDINFDLCMALNPSQS
jgi:hypothetical protein